jgi:cellulose synthase/poly-beta-1,6-N-acetylglucosamine synthase-like glycosyltransferase
MSSTRILVGSLGLVAYTFVGYPAVMCAAARLRPRPIRSDASFEPRLTVIVAAWNEEAVIAGKLENLRSLAYPQDLVQIIVAADGSDDATVELANSVDGTVVLHRPERAGKLAAIARAATAATGDIILVSDANNHYSSGALRALVAPFADPEVGVVTGRKQIDDDLGRPLDQAEGLYWRYESKLKEWETAVGSVTAVAGEILAFRREAFHIPERMTLTEDFVQAMVAALDGWRLVYVPEAVSRERASATVEDEAVRRSRIVAGRWQAMRMLLPKLLVRRPKLAIQVISHKGLRPLVPVMLVCAGVSNIPAARSSAWARWLGLGQAAFYGMALLGQRNERLRKENPWLFIPYYFCRMNFAAVRGAGTLLRNEKPTTWEKVNRG